MVTLGTLFVGLAVVILSYKTGYDHAEVKCDVSPSNVDEVIRNYERAMHDGD